MCLRTIVNVWLRKYSKLISAYDAMLVLRTCLVKKWLAVIGIGVMARDRIFLNSKNRLPSKAGFIRFYRD